MIKISVAQIKNSTSLDKNFEAIWKCLEVSKKEDVDLVVFPECSLSGFSALIKECTEEVLSPYLEKIISWSENSGIAVLLPTAFKSDQIYNSGYFITGKEFKKFFKVGLTESEQKFFSVPDDYKKEIFQLGNYRFANLICMEAQQEPNLYFKNGSVDFILWPGYWGWQPDDGWSEVKQDGSENPIYTNMKSWTVPLIQSNFSYNDQMDQRDGGPRGLSYVVDSKNKLVHKGSFEEESCFFLTFDKETQELKILKEQNIW